MPLRGISKDENRGRSPVEPGNVTGAVSPSFSLAPGPLVPRPATFAHSGPLWDTAHARRRERAGQKTVRPHGCRVASSVLGALRVLVITPTALSARRADPWAIGTGAPTWRRTQPPRPPTGSFACWRLIPCS